MLHMVHVGQGSAQSLNAGSGKQALEGIGQVATFGAVSAGSTPQLQAACMIKSK